MIRSYILGLGFIAFVHAQPPAGTSPSPADYTLGPADQVSIFVTGLPDEFTDKTFRIGPNGDITLPFAGRVHAAGVNIEDFQTELKHRFAKFVRNPDVVVTVTEFASQPVSVLGAVNSPGVRQLQGRKNLFEVISLSGGLRTDAGTTVKITRDLKNGAVPLPDASPDTTGRYSVASVRIKDIMNATRPADNIVVMPGDTVTVPRAQLVYVVGSVTKPGGFPLGENEALSALQVISLAEGLQKGAAGDKAKILRTVSGSTARAEIPVNIKKIMEGKTEDITLRPDDILFVPNSAAKNAGYRTLDAIVNAATGVAIYGRY
jgi:polysaccharide export outer membrane protein